jgi:hypothetical protein
MIKHITLWELIMQQFDAQTFIGFADTLGYRYGIQDATEILNDDVTKKVQGLKVSDDDRTSTIDALKNFRPHCVKLNLPLCTNQVDRLIKLYSDSTITQGILSEAEEYLRTLLFDEMKSKLFFYFEPNKQEFLLGEDLFGEQVAKAFPSTEYDIKHAGRCLAFEEWTASIFHCMKVVEIGLNTLAKELGVNSDRPNWGSILDDIENKILEINKLPKTNPLKKREQFYSEAASQFRLFKNAWRNHVMHVRSIYDSTDADKVFRSVQDFMSHLSLNLHEDNS